MRKYGNRRWIARCLRGLSYNSKYRSDAKSIDQLQESIRLSEEIGDRPNMAQCILDLAITRMYLEGKFTEILSDLSMVREICQEIGYVPDSIESIVSHMESVVYLHQGNYAQSKETLRQNLQLCNRIQNQRIAAYNLYGLGDIALHEGNYPKAQRFYQKSLELFDSLQEHHKTSPHAKLALVARANHQPQQAAFHICQILVGAKALSSHLLIYLALPVSALLLVDLGKERRAIEIYSLARQYPFVRNSKWLDDLVGQEIRQVEANLASEIAEDCRKSGSNLPVWETVDDLITYFSEKI